MAFRNLPKIVFFICSALIAASALLWLGVEKTRANSRVTSSDLVLIDVHHVRNAEGEMEMSLTIHNGGELAIKSVIIRVACKSQFPNGEVSEYFHLSNAPKVTLFGYSGDVRDQHWSIAPGSNEKFTVKAPYLADVDTCKVSFAGAEVKNSIRNLQ